MCLGLWSLIKFKFGVEGLVGFRIEGLRIWRVWESFMQKLDFCREGMSCRIRRGPADMAWAIIMTSRYR